jgi:NADH-quinone oxidoreductase subunit G
VSADLVNIVINGTKLAVPAGEMIIESARRIGVEIPHFCYHPRLSKEAGANCRMCLVEVAMPRVGPDGTVTIAKMPKPQTSCSLPAAEGMVIETETPALIEARKGILEFLLINHPLDCPICDRGGECPLQNNTLHYGPPTTRYVEDKRHLPKAYPLSDHVVLDRERCIHCARCTRFAEDISGDAQLGFLKRGAEMEISVRTGEKFTSLFSGNTIELCPVGALLSRAYRFRGRPWDLMTQKSICTECSNGCNIKLDHRAGRFVRVNARTNEAVSEEWTCDRGKFGMDYISGPDRLTQPLIRRGARFEPASWDEALDTVADAFKAAGSTAGFLGGTRSSNEDLFVIQRLFREVLGSNNLDHRTIPCLTLDPSGTAAKPDPAPPDALVHLERVNAFVAFGADLAWEQPIAFLRVRKAWRRFGCRVVAIGGHDSSEDNRPASIRAIASGTVRHRPGRELDAALLLLREVVAQSEGNVTLPANVSKTLQNLKISASDAGIEQEALTEAARVLLMRNGDSDQASPTMAVWVGEVARRRPELAEVVAVLQGVITASGHRGQVSVPAMDVNEQGARDLGILPHMLPGYRPAASAGRNTAEQLQDAANGRMAALWVSGVDLVNAYWDREAARRALEEAPFVVVSDIRMTDTARMANVVLPVTSVAERHGTFTNVEGRVQQFWKAYDPPDGVRQEWRIACQLAARLGAPIHYATSRAILADIAANVPIYAGCGPDKLGDEGVRWLNLTEGETR